MTIQTTFDLKQKIFIKELKISGVIISMFIGNDYGLQYHVRYFKDNESKTSYFYDFELELFKETVKTVGFNIEKI